ncbi:response regulator [Paenibacillus piri]|uniref:Response regulator n=1 Tax=Paenibacillus piri TaxID=2547395 RepID=A0A4R5KUM0_9BACL|nr:response regulator [Paenibacillus piri]TDF98818.1 response regulator [Paenibacillus piri]
MYSLMIVEDEEIIREGLKQCLDWPSLQIGAIYEAADGKSALDLAVAVQPDIMLTDVVMAEMDGIELVGALREHVSGKNIRVIMISGHENIDYIKSALRLQVIDYLLKPFHTEELESIIRKVLQDCETDRRQSSHIQRLEEQMSLSRSMVKWRFLHDLCFRSLPSEEIQQYMDVLEEDTLGKGPFRAVYIEAEADTELLSDLEAQWAGTESIVLFRIGKGIYGGIWAENLQPDRDTITRLLGGWRLKAGVGSSVMRMDDIYQSFQQARVALIHLSPDKQYASALIDYAASQRPKEELMLKEIAQQQEAILRAMENNERLALASTLHPYFRLIGLMEQRSLPYCQAYCSMLLIHINRHFSVLIEDSAANPTVLALESIHAAHDPSELEPLVLHTIDTLTGIIHSRPDQRKVVRDITGFIQSAYREELTLTQIAAHVHLSPNYLANLFKKETGMTVNDCITAVRITEAKRLLAQESSLLISDLAEMVGYKDGKYFTKLFKREVGMNPSEYREKAR